MNYALWHCANSRLWLRPRQNVRHFADDTFKRISLNENASISIKISPNFVPLGPINNIPTLVQIMAWWPGDKPLSEAMMVSLLTHICVIRPQWVYDSTGRKRLQHLLIIWRHLSLCFTWQRSNTCKGVDRCRVQAYVIYWSRNECVDENRRKYIQWTNCFYLKSLLEKE